MALRIKEFELPDGTILEDAYLRVQNVTVSNVDYEFFDKAEENVDNIEEVLKWVTRIESKATVFVWADEFARSNRATVLNWFTFEFQYDLSEHSNPFEQAYKQLNKIYLNGEGC